MPASPQARSKAAGEGEGLGAAGAQRQLVHLSARPGPLPPAFPSGAEPGQPAAGAGGGGASEGAAESELAPGPARREPAPPPRSARRPTSSIPRRRAAGACCPERAESAPGEAWVFLITGSKPSGQGEPRPREGGGSPAPLSALRRARFGAPRALGPPTAQPPSSICSSPCLTP